MSRRLLIALALAGLVCGVVIGAITVTSEHIDDPVAEAVLRVLTGWSFIGTGLFAWWRRPANGTGRLMVAAGFAWFATSLSASDNDVLFTIGITLDALFPGIIGHLLMAFPSGRLHTPLERRLVAATYFLVTVLQVPSLLFEEPDTPRNLLIIHGDQPLSDALDALQLWCAAVVLGMSWIVIIRRARAGGPSQRRALMPVLVTGGAAFAAFLVAKVFDAAGHKSEALEWASEALVITIPYGFLFGLLRTRLAHGTAVSELLARLGQAPDSAELRAALADALGDPTLWLAYWLPGPRRFVDAAGRDVAMPDGGWTEVELQGRRIAAIVHDPALTEERDLVRAAGGAAALALENQRLSAELRARIEELRASRARVVQAGDSARRRLERDLHDGAQSRLVALALKLKLARMRVDDASDAATLLDESSAELQASLDELRELARGLHPVVLTDRGLNAAIRILADRAPVPVDVAALPDARLPAPVELAVYFVVAEALTNVAKYAQASTATVAVTVTDGRVAVDVSDDGVGGADLTEGSGLRGLSDRVAALDGSIELHSPRGAGTHLRAEIPLEND
jgi:signal transduction histidine kinase